MVRKASVRVKGEMNPKKARQSRKKAKYYEAQALKTGRNKARRKASTERRKASRPKQPKGVTGCNLVRHAARYMRRKAKAAKIELEVVKAE